MYKYENCWLVLEFLDNRLKIQTQSFTIKIEFYHSINNIFLRIIANFDVCTLFTKTMLKTF